MQSLLVYPPTQRVAIVDDSKTFLLKIKAYTPETIPMDRLAEYMKQFALLLGESKSVHFSSLTHGSTNLLARVEHEALPAVSLRVRQIHTGMGPADAMRAFDALDELLANDNTSGAIIRLNPEQEEMLTLPGATRELPPVFSGITQPTTLDGVVIRVGGTRDEIPVHIQTRSNTGSSIESHCFATRALAKEFGKHLFGSELRLYGDGKWQRDERGRWLLQKFTITRYEEIDPTTHKEAVAELRAIQTRRWLVGDPWSDLDELRGDESEDQ